MFAIYIITNCAPSNSQVYIIRVKVLNICVYQYNNQMYISKMSEKDIRNRHLPSEFIRDGDNLFLI